MQIERQIRYTISRDFMTPVEIKGLRLRLHETQAQLAERIGVGLDTVRAWEHGAGKPAGAAKKVLQDLSDDLDEKQA